MSLWGKVDQTSGVAHALIWHLAETTAVAALLWDEVLAPGTQAIIARALGLSVAEARAWALFLVGLHDLGKASPSFQSKWPAAVPVLQDLGYRFHGNVEPVPHGRVTAIALSRVLMERGVTPRVANEMAKLAGGHHGVFDTARSMAEQSPRAVGGD